MKYIRFVIVFLITMMLTAAANAELLVWFLDVGEADCSIIVCDGEAMLIDGGNAEDSALVYSCLKNSLGITTLKAIVATHPHEDHIGGIPGAMNACSVERIYTPVLQYDNSERLITMQSYAELQGTPIIIPTNGETFRLGGADVELILPRVGHEDLNDDSIVVRVSYGTDVLLFCADAGTEAEQDMLSSGIDLRADVLRVGHHGSNSSTSQAFLTAVEPSYAVISVGKDNENNHPSENVLERLKTAGVTVLRTDLQGTIVMRSNGDGVCFDQVATQESMEYESPFICNINSMKLHRGNCRWVYGIAQANRVPFETAAEAFSKGFEACGGCKPK